MSVPFTTGTGRRGALAGRVLLMIALLPVSASAQDIDPCALLSLQDRQSLRLQAGTVRPPLHHQLAPGAKAPKIEVSVACEFYKPTSGLLSITVSRASSDEDARTLGMLFTRILEGGRVDPNAISSWVEPRCAANGCRLTIVTRRLIATIEWSGMENDTATGIARSVAISLTRPPTECKSIDTGQVQPIWRSEEEWKGQFLAYAPFTLELMAQRAAPILWPSPQEPTKGPIPRAVPAASWSFEDAGSEPRVYYRIRRVLLRDVNSRKEKEERLSAKLADPAMLTKPWSDDDPDLDIRDLNQIFIRYLFYFPEDRGIGQHAHDLESAEVSIGVESCTPSVDGRCVRKAFIRTVTTSAHGVGWYTSILDVCAAPDTRLPLTLLVEEGKHATAPDRDGDGEFKPHYDVNVYSNDAWGVRDTAATRQLGGTSFRAEMTKRRPHSTQVLPRPIYLNQRLRETYLREFDGAPAGDVLKQLEKNKKYPDDEYYAHSRYYALIPSVTAEICKGVDDVVSYGSRRRRFDGALVAHALTVQEKKDGDELFHLLEEKGFCDPPKVVSRSDRLHQLANVVNTISPGPRNEYGFMNEWQRLSLAYRHDEGSGLSAVIPLGLEMPGVGGWLVGKMDLIVSDWNGTLPDTMQKLGLSAMYTPSASRFADWYVAVGGERVAVMPAPGRDHASRHGHSAADTQWRVSEELGMRFRFAVLKAPFVKFYGGRVGIRAASLGHFRDVRLVFEVGAGAW